MPAPVTAPVSAIYAALLALLIVALASRIPLLRRRHRVGIGSGGNEQLALAVRVHGNAVEYIPVFLVLLLLAEIGGLAAWALHAAGSLFFLARVLHAFGLGRSPAMSFGRFWGTAASWTIIVVLAATLLARTFA